jgi:hypothetical protein
MDDNDDEKVECYTTLRVHRERRGHADRWEQREELREGGECHISMPRRYGSWV